MRRGTDPGLPKIQAKSAEVYQAALDRKLVTLGVLRRVADSLASVKGRKAVILPGRRHLTLPGAAR
jgi:hypothetical protein